MIFVANGKWRENKYLQPWLCATPHPAPRSELYRPPGTLRDNVAALVQARLQLIFTDGNAHGEAEDISKRSAHREMMDMILA